MKIMTLMGQTAQQVCKLHRFYNKFYFILNPDAATNF